MTAELIEISECEKSMVAPLLEELKNRGIAGRLGIREQVVKDICNPSSTKPDAEAALSSRYSSLIIPGLRRRLPIV